MRNRLWILLMLALLAWSYFARPVYDFAWIAAGRLTDIAAVKWGTPLLRRDRQVVVDRAFEQGDEIAAYLRVQRAATPRANPLPAPDFSTEGAYTRSVEPARARLRESLRYPPPGFDAAPAGPVQETLLGEDELASYRELRIPALPGIHSTGLYLRPRAAGVTEKLPLVIAAHGRGGAPEPTADGKLPMVVGHTRDLAWDALRRGYAVWLPSYVHFGRSGDDFRERLTVRAWEAGTSLPAIEIAKTVKALDALARRPDIDAGRVAMVGVSYGGFYTLYTTALDPRVRVAVLAAYFNDRAAVLDASEPYGFLDWRFPDSLTLWRDPAVTALVAPRPLLIQAGNQDQLFPIEGARRTAPQAQQVYDQLGAGERFRFTEFVARHDFNGPLAMNFIDQHLGRGLAAAAR